MDSRLPVARQISWISVLPQFAVMAMLMSAFWLMGTVSYILFGAIAYLLLSFSLRHLIAHHQRSGMSLFHQEKFAEAIPHFASSYRFFSRHPWLDRWRSVTLLTSSRISYREMALLN